MEGSATGEELPPEPASPATQENANAAAPREAEANEPGANTSAESPAPEGGRAPGGAIDLDAEDDVDADMAALAEEAKGADLDSEPRGREIVYRVTPKGLVIEIDGFHLRPQAKPFKEKNGAYGVELVVTAESFDGRQYWLSKPKAGPFSIAGKIESKSSPALRFADRREGEGEELIHSGEPRTLRQRWPGRGQPKLWWGQTLTLEVGLWGVRADSGRERPVRRLFLVKMVAGNPPQAVVSPPTLDWGT